MHKDELVYSQANDELIGSVELKDLNWAFHNIESEPADTKKVNGKQITGFAVCFLAHSLPAKNCLLVVQFATNSLTADQLINMFWEIVATMEIEC